MITLSAYLSEAAKDVEALEAGYLSSTITGAKSYDLVEKLLASTMETLTTLKAVETSLLEEQKEGYSTEDMGDEVYSVEEIGGAIGKGIKMVKDLVARLLASAGKFFKGLFSKTAKMEKHVDGMEDKIKKKEEMVKGSSKNEATEEYYFINNLGYMPIDCFRVSDTALMSFEKIIEHLSQTSEEVRSLKLLLTVLEIGKDSTMDEFTNRLFVTLKSFDSKVISDGNSKTVLAAGTEKAGGVYINLTPGEEKVRTEYLFKVDKLATRGYKVTYNELLTLVDELKSGLRAVKVLEDELEKYIKTSNTVMEKMPDDSSAVKLEPAKIKLLTSLVKALIAHYMRSYVGGTSLIDMVEHNNVRLKGDKALRT